jgi:hypothetical protein
MFYHTFDNKRPTIVDFEKEALYKRYLDNNFTLLNEDTKNIIENYLIHKKKGGKTKKKTKRKQRKTKKFKKRIFTK